MPLATTKAMREKYIKLQLPSGLRRSAPGGKDILKLCEIADRLENIVRELQHRLPTEQQNDVERKLWGVEA